MGGTIGGMVTRSIAALASMTAEELAASSSSSVDPTAAEGRFLRIDLILGLKNLN